MNSDLIGVIIILFLFVTFSICAFFLGTGNGKQIIRNEAVIKNHAEYIADKNGQPLWQWKENK